ncbi:MAG TPA: hypothetical protein VLR45_10520 [Desulfoprunum sp.]|jgi:hypothetical protein|nr:hypothetical protein [Desulfoprunum sp.]
MHYLEVPGGGGKRVFPAVGQEFMIKNPAAVFAPLLDFIQWSWSAFMQEGQVAVLIHYAVPGDGDA